MYKSYFQKIICKLSLGCVFFYSSTSTAESVTNNDIEAIRALLKLDLADLLDVEVTSVSKKSQKLSKSAAAVFVITQEDIRRSGVTTIPEALKMVPGVQVARINAYAYAISIRGFNSSFANKLLVLIDGRSVYTPEFSGVYWDSVDMPMDDIERIEVIRGTGGTLWGANAVNGVINILTKHTKDSKGLRISAGAGTEQKYNVELQQGDVLSADHHINYRISAKLSKHDDFPPQGEELSVENGWEKRELGFRLDGSPNADTNWTLIGNYQDLRLGSDQWDIYVAQVHVDSVNLLSRWEKSFSKDSKLTAQLYYDDNQREDLSLFTMNNQTTDFELRHEWNISEKHNLLWGIGYRHIKADTPFTTYYEFKKLDSNLYNIFVQDDVHLVPDEWTLTLGTKLEHHYYTGLELQPSARLLWTPNEENSLWASISRAVRTPSRLEENSKTERPSIPGEYHPDTSEPFTTLYSGNEDLQAESVIAYEIGARHQLSHVFSIDVASFINRYNDLVLMTTDYSHDSEIGYIQSSEHRNGMRANAYGIEIALNWMMSDYWQLLGAYTWTKIDAETLLNNVVDDRYSIAAETRIPRHQFSLRSNFNLTEQLELDFWLYHVSQLPTRDQVKNFYLPDYTTLNARLAWHPTKNIELSLTGQNLLDKQHSEFASEPLVLYFREDVQRNIYGQIRWNF